MPARRARCGRRPARQGPRCRTRPATAPSCRRGCLVLQEVRSPRPPAVHGRRPGARRCRSGPLGAVERSAEHRARRPGAGRRCRVRRSRPGEGGTWEVGPAGLAVVGHPHRERAGRPAATSTRLASARWTPVGGAPGRSVRPRRGRRDREPAAVAGPEVRGAASWTTVQPAWQGTPRRVADPSVGISPRSTFFWSPTASISWSCRWAAKSLATRNQSAVTSSETAPPVRASRRGRDPQLRPQDGRIGVRQQRDPAEGLGLDGQRGPERLVAGHPDDRGRVPAADPRQRALGPGHVRAGEIGDHRRAVVPLRRQLPVPPAHADRVGREHPQRRRDRDHGDDPAGRRPPGDGGEQRERRRVRPARGQPPRQPGGGRHDQVGQQQAAISASSPARPPRAGQ